MPETNYAIAKKQKPIAMEQQEAIPQEEAFIDTIINKKI